jgi:hypothetical protein
MVDLSSHALFSFSFLSVLEANDLDVDLQVLDITESEKNKILTLCDSEYHYDNFVLRKNLTKNLDVKKYDMIKINKIGRAYDTKKNKNVFSIKIKEIIAHYNEPLCTTKPFDYLKPTENENEIFELNQNDIPVLHDESIINLRKDNINNINTNFLSNENQVLQDIDHNKNFTHNNEINKNESGSDKENSNSQNSTKSKDRENSRNNSKNRNKGKDHVFNLTEKKPVPEKFSGRFSVFDSNTRKNVFHLPSTDIKKSGGKRMSLMNNNINTNFNSSNISIFSEQIFPQDKKIHSASHINTSEIQRLPPIAPIKKPLTVKKEYVFNLNMLTTLVTSFHLKVRVIGIRITKFNSLYIDVRDEDETLSEIYVPPKRFEKFKDSFKLDKIYIITNGDVSNNNGKYRHYSGKIKKFKIELLDSSEVTELPEDNSIISDVMNSLVKLEKIKESFINKNFYVDVLVYIKEIEEVLFNSMYTKCLKVYDENKYIIDIYVSTNIFTTFEPKIKPGELIFIKNLFINFDEGYVLKSGKNTYVETFNDSESDIVLNMIEKCINITFNDLKSHKELFNDFIGFNCDYLNDIFNLIVRARSLNVNYLNPTNFPGTKIVKLTIAKFLNDDTFVYYGCEICKTKKKSDLKEENEKYKCEKCNKEVNSKAYFRISVQGRDCSASVNLIMFDELARIFLGTDPNTYAQAKNEKNEKNKKFLNDLENSLIGQQFYFMLKVDYKKEIHLDRIEDIQLDVRYFFKFTSYKNEIKNLIKIIPLNNH